MHEYSINTIAGSITIVGRRNEQNNTAKNPVNSKFITADQGAALEGFYYIKEFTMDWRFCTVITIMENSYKQKT